MKIVDVYSIVDEYSDTAFAACKESLYHILNFRVLKIDEIRKIDFKEKLAEFFASNETAQANEDFEIKLAELMDDLVSSHLFIKGEREHRYYEKLITDLARLKKQEITLGDIDGVVLIYICLFRAYTHYFEGKKGDKKLSINLKENFYLTRDDAVILRYIYEGLRIKKYYAQNKGLVHAVKKNQKKNPLPIFLTDAEKKYLYVMSTLFFFRILQYEGEI